MSLDTGMERTDSSSAMASLAMYQDESDEETHRPTAVDYISDEDVGTDNSRPSSRPIMMADDEGSQSQPPSVESVKHSTPIKSKRKVMKLVSYGTDDLEDAELSDSEPDDDEEEIEDDDGENDDLKRKTVTRTKRKSSLNADIASSLSRSVLHMPADEIQLPPQPQGNCSIALQEKIERLYEKMKREGMNMNSTIQRRKDFRNPSIYEKLIEWCGIDEKGSNFPIEIFDPLCWDRSSFHDALDKAQKIEMEKREKDRKDRTKVEFVTGTKKSSESSALDDKKRKSKWDNLGQSQMLSKASSMTSGMSSSSSVNLTTTVTGTKSTVISSSGNIAKKSKN